MSSLLIVSSKGDPDAVKSLIEAGAVVYQTTNTLIHEQVVLPLFSRLFILLMTSSHTTYTCKCLFTLQQQSLITITTVVGK